MFLDPKKCQEHGLRGGAGNQSHLRAYPGGDEKYHIPTQVSDFIIDDAAEGLCGVGNEINGIGWS